MLNENTAIFPISWCDMVLQIKSTFTVEKVENGFVVRCAEANRAIHVPYHFDIARQIERFMHDEAVSQLEAAEALSGERLTSDSIRSLSP